jgi:hypothetical protein
MWPLKWLQGSLYVWVTLPPMPYDEILLLTTSLVIYGRHNHFAFIAVR